MTTTSTENRHLPTEEWLTSLNVEWEFVSDLPLGKIDKIKSLSNQSRMDEPINEEVVERYTEDMKRGDVFPPLLCRQVGSGGIIESKVYNLGGNHRFIAAERAHTKLSAYVVRCTPEMATRLMYEDNRRHGFPPSEEDRINMAVNLIEGQGYSAGDAAKVVGISQSKISVAVGAVRSEARAKELGLTFFSELPRSSRWRLGALRSDPVFAEASKLALNAGLKAGDIYNFVSMLNEARSDEQALAMIGDKVEELSEQITGSGAPRAGRQATPVARFRQGMTAITSALPSSVVSGVQGPDAEDAILLRIDRMIQSANEVKRLILERRAEARKAAKKVSK